MQDGSSSAASDPMERFRRGDPDADAADKRLESRDTHEGVSP